MGTDHILEISKVLMLRKRRQGRLGCHWPQGRVVLPIALVEYLEFLSCDRGEERKG